MSLVHFIQMLFFKTLISFIIFTTKQSFILYSFKNILIRKCYFNKGSKTSLQQTLLLALPKYIDDFIKERTFNIIFLILLYSSFVKDPLLNYNIYK